jgi:hypothetical protein
MDMIFEGRFANALFYQGRELTSQRQRSAIHTCIQQRPKFIPTQKLGIIILRKSPSCPAIGPPKGDRLFHQALSDHLAVQIGKLRWVSHHDRGIYRRKVDRMGDRLIQQSQ